MENIFKDSIFSLTGLKPEEKFMVKLDNGTVYENLSFDERGILYGPWKLNLFILGAILLRAGCIVTEEYNHDFFYGVGLMKKLGVKPYEVFTIYDRCDSKSHIEEILLEFHFFFDSNYMLRRESNRKIDYIMTGGLAIGAFKIVRHIPELTAWDRVSLEEHKKKGYTHIEKVSELLGHKLSQPKLLYTKDSDDRDFTLLDCTPTLKLSQFTRKYSIEELLREGSED